jgi:predicted MFS family arabinose efflux permease
VRLLSSQAEKAEFAALFFVQAMAMGFWFVPLTTVLEAHGYRELRPLAFATTGIAAFISPLIFGALADRSAAPTIVLRWLAVATSAAAALASFAMGQRWPAWLVLALIQLHSLCGAPTWSLASTIVLSRLRDARKEFGPIRSVATLGWVVGCWVVSALGADASPLAGYSSSITWLVVAGLTCWLPAVVPARKTQPLTLRERLGLDALTLLRHPDHRVVFLTVALFSIPLAAFYPYTAPQLQQLGFQHTTAWMSLGQTTEIIAMISLAALFSRWRLKWIFALGLGLGLVRFALAAFNESLWLLVSIVLHGGSFTFVIITAQIYLDVRVEAAWRARAQALMTLMMNGIGNLFGFLGGGAWFAVCTEGPATRWTLFWGGLAGAVAVVLAYFLAAYRGQQREGGEAMKR